MISKLSLLNFKIFLQIAGLTVVKTSTQVVPLTHCPVPLPIYTVLKAMNEGHASATIMLHMCWCTKVVYALVLYFGGLMSGSHNKEESKIKLYAYIICTQRKPTLSCNKTDSKANRKPVEVERELLKHYSLVLSDLSLTNL